MRIAAATAALALVATPTATAPNAIAFFTARDGLAGTKHGISLTVDGGRVWRQVRRTARPVVSIRILGSTSYATFDDGETLMSSDRGRRWQLSTTPIPVPPAPCPPGVPATSANQVVFTPAGKEYALCVGQPAAGSQSKFVYEAVNGAWRLIAATPGTGPAHGGISLYGYPQGIAMADNGFGLLWESRGTLYVTRDGGHHWLGLPKVAVPEIDFSGSG